MKKKLAQGAIATGAGTLAYTVPSRPKAIYVTTVTCIDIANTTSAAITVSLHLVPVGGTVDTTNMLLPAISIPGNLTLQWTGEQVLNTGDFIQAKCGNAGLTMNITGDEERFNA
jgi:hypothetical protein